MISVMTGYILGLFGLFILSVSMTGWQTTLWFFGILHGVCTLLILGIWWLAKHRESSIICEDDLEAPAPISRRAYPTATSTPAEPVVDKRNQYPPVYQQVNMR